jgi:hypothetical protein
MKPQQSHRPFRVLVLLLATTLATYRSAEATDIFWNVANGDFNTAANWNPASVPAMFDQAIIDNGGTSIVSSGIPTLDTLTVGSATGTSGTLKMTGGDLYSTLVKLGEVGTASVSVSSAILRAGGGSLFVGGSGDTSNGTGVMTVTGSSSLVTSGDDVQFGRSGSGTLNFQGGRMTGGYTVVGKFGTGLWNHSGGVYDQDFGDIEIGDGGRPDQAGIPGLRTGTINLTGGVIQCAGYVAIGNRHGGGTVNVSGGALDVTGEVNDGSIVIGRGMDWEASPGSGGPASMRVTGGNSIIIANGSLQMNPAHVASSSTLIEEINSSTQTAIKVAGDANIGNGTLKVVLNGYTPVTGNTWTIIEAGADLTAGKAAVDAMVSAGGYPALSHATPAAIGNLVGTFASTDFSLAPLTAGLSWNVQYVGKQVLLKVTGVAVVGVPGDYNGNGVVDAADYVLWRNGGPLQNEVNTVGTVDASDYTAWRARFGNTSGAGSSIAAQGVPEPNAVLLLAIGLFVGSGVRASQRKG